MSKKKIKKSAAEGSSPHLSASSHPRLTETPANTRTASPPEITEAFGSENQKIGALKDPQKTTEGWLPGFSPERVG